MELNSNLFIVKHEVQGEQIVDGHKWCWIDIAMASEEGSEVSVGIIRFVMIIKLDNIKILLSIKEFVGIITI